MKRKINKKLVIFSLILLIACIVGLVLFFVNKNNLKKFDNIDSDDNVNNIDDTDKSNIDTNMTPVLKLKEIIIKEGEDYSIDSFVEFCIDSEDNNDNCNFRYENDEMNDYNRPGTYKIAIIAIDKSGNQVVSTTTLTITEKNIENEMSNNDTEIKENVVDENNSNNTLDSEVNNSSTPTEVRPNNKTSTTTKPVTTQKTKVNSITETTENYSYKYGTTIKKITYLYYDVYSDGSKVLTGSYDEYEYDYSTFNASTNDLKAEATTLANQNYETINQVLSYVNQYRSEVGAQPLVLDSSLSLAATIRSLEMGWGNTFSHTRPSGLSCFTVINELGINYYNAGENIAYGYADPSSVANGWRNSEGHYQNMISSDFSKIGIGLANVDGINYWTQLFTN